MTPQELLDILNALVRPVSIDTFKEEVLQPFGITPQIEFASDLLFDITSVVPAVADFADGERFTLAMQGGITWNVVPGFFEIPNLSIEVTWQINGDPTATQEIVFFSGMISGSVDVLGETATLTYDLAAPSGEAMTGTFPEIDIAQLVSEYLTSVTLPEDFPTLDFDALPVSIHPGNRTFTFNGDSSSSWPLINDILSLNEVTLNVTATLEADDTLSVEGDISGALTFPGGTVIRPAFSFGEEYNLSATVDTLPLGDILTTLVEEVTSIQLPDGLPETLSFEDVEVTIDEDNDFYAVKANSGATWDIIDDLFTADNLALSFRVFVDESDETQIEGGLAANISLADVVFTIGVDFSNDTFNVTGGLAEDQSLSFFKLAQEVIPFDINLPEDFDVTFENLNVDVSPLESLPTVSDTNSKYTFSGDAVTDWVLIPDVISLSSVSLNLEVTTENGTATVGGSLSGNLAIGGSTAVIGYAFDSAAEEFKLIAELPDLSLDDIINGLLEKAGVELPTSLPTFSFSDIVIEVRPEEGIYRLFSDKESQGLNWDILPGLFSLTNVGIDFTATSENDTIDIEGGIEGTLNLGDDVAITMKFAFTADDYVVDGSIDKLNLGNLAEGLLDAAGFEVDLPDFDIGGQDLSDPDSLIGLSILPDDLKFSLSGSIGDGDDLLSFYGINIDLPTITFTITIEKIDDEWVLYITADIPGDEELTVSTNFAWLRDVGGPILRELQNDPSGQPSSDDPLIALKLDPDGDQTIILLKTPLGNSDATEFFTGPRGEPANLEDNWDLSLFFNGIELGSDDFEAAGDFIFPFLFQDDGSSTQTSTTTALARTTTSNTNGGNNGNGSVLTQNIKITPPGSFSELFQNGEITIPFGITITIAGIDLNSEIILVFSLARMAFRVEHSGGIEILSDKEELLTVDEGEEEKNRELLGLEWFFFGEKKGDKYHHFTLVTKDFNYQIQQAPGARIEVAYTKASKDPIKFQITDFALSSNGLTITADVLDDPARLNGVDTKFRFAGSQLKIVENRIQDFTLSGSGPLPPDLVGDAMVDISMQFKQVDGSLTLVAGAAKLRGNKILDAKATRFQFSIDAIGLKFVNDGQFHLFFTLTGTARFVLASGDDKNGALALLPTIQIDLHECPLTGDASVIAKHISFLIELPKPVSFPIFGAYEFELRAIGFLPNFEVFDAAAMQITGQVKFAQGPGDTANNEPDYHSLYIALPEPGSFIPRLYMDRLPLSIQMGEAFKLDGVLEFLNSDLEKGFAGEGVLEIKGLPPIAAAFAFLRVRKKETDPFVRAWFIFIELRQVSFRVPVLEFYIREIGLGFGYRYTLVAIKAADEANDLGELISELKVLSRTAGDLSKRDRWAVDIEDPGQDLRWTIVFRAMIAQLSAAPSPLTWNESKEEKLANVYLFDAVIAFRSDLTFFMNVRGWLNTSYGEFVKQRNEGNDLEPLFSGFVFLWPRQKRFLAHLASNPNGHLGSKPPLPSFVEDAVRNGQFSATLLIEPNLMHFELGWPNMLRWSNKIGPLNAEMRGGFIFRISDRELVLGISYTARASLDVEASINLGLVGASLRARADASLGARFIGVVEFGDNAKPTVYGAIGMELNIRVDINLWIKIPLLFKTIKLSYSLTFRLNFTAGLELGFDGLTNAGLKGSGSVSVSAMGHRLHFSAKFSANGDAVTAARKTTQQYLNIGLEATDVEPVPGIEQEVSSSSPTAIAAPVSASPAFSAAVRMDDTPSTLEVLTEEFQSPDYRIFVLRKNQNPADSSTYFVLLPRAEGDTIEAEISHPGFLPVPPVDDIGSSTDDAHIDFTVQFGSAPDSPIEQFNPFTNNWDTLSLEGGDSPEPVSWKADWDAVIFDEVDEFSSAEGQETQPVEDDEKDFDSGMTLRSYLRTAYITNAYDDPGDTENPVVIPISDPMGYVDGVSVEDQRVQNPSDNAFEAAVRGAQEQFRGSPFFKRDPNLEYDQALETAFQEDRTVYTSTGYTPRVEYTGTDADIPDLLREKLLVSGSELIWADEAFTDEEYNQLNSIAQNCEDPTTTPAATLSCAVTQLIVLMDDMATQKQAIQVRSLVINDLIQDVRAYVDASDAERDEVAATSIPFRMGLVFRVDGDALPEWLSGDVASEEGPTLNQRNTTSSSTPEGPTRSISTFNIDLSDFGTNPPQFQNVRHYTDAGTVAIAWNLTQSFPEELELSEAQRNPDHNLLHYDVRRLPLDGRDREVRYQVKAAAALCPADHGTDGGSITLDSLKPRFQLVDHFPEESDADLAALPSTGRSYLYTIIPIDYSGSAGHPLTLVATRFPNEPPRVPVDGKLIVEYTLSDETIEVQDLSGLDAAIPEVLTPNDPIKVTWTNPTEQQEGPRVGIKDRFLVFRKETTLPIGNYGLDSATSRPRSKQLPTSNARALQSDIKIPLTAPGGSRSREATITVQQLKDAGVLPDNPNLWRPESWRIFFQTVSTKDVPSPLSPVELVLRVKEEKVTDFEERRPPELEWLPKPVRMALLPPEDQRATPGLAHFPMPNGSFLFNTAETSVNYDLHPAELRAIRFRWNQGPSSQPDYPLDLTASYDLLQLDTDAHTTDTFKDQERLSEALTKVQEIQMISAEDLLLTPGDTLSTQAWEAWYPSTMRRLLKPDERIEGSEALLSPWFSWRDSILDWPEWEGLTDTEGSVRDQQLHPFLNDIASRFKGEPVHTYPGDTLDPLDILVELRSSMDPNGSFPPDTALSYIESLPGAEIQFIENNRTVFITRLENGQINTYSAYRGTLQTHPAIQPGDLTALLNGTPQGPDPYGWGILQRFGLCATLSLQNNDGDIISGDELLNAIQFVVFLEHNLSTYRKYLFVEQLYQRNKSISLSQSKTENDALLGIIQLSLRPSVLQVRDYKKITLSRSAEADETLSQLQAAVIIDHSLPYSLIDQSDMAAGQADIDPELDEDGTVVPVKRTFLIPLNGSTDILIRSRDLSTFGAALAEFEEGKNNNDVILINVQDFQPTDDLATYFTVPADELAESISADLASQERTHWLRLKRYAESLNSTDPEVPDTQKIDLPTSGEDLDKALPEVLSWLQRFMDISEDATVQASPDQVVETGPWIATAYPKSGTPAHATPDESGRLTYNHLIRDGWAHNYRYYFRPNDRYNLLWNSLLLSPDLFPRPDEDAPEADTWMPNRIEEAVPDPENAGLDVVIERINPIDRPVILSSSRLDPPTKPGNPSVPGRTWEVIIGQHREQSLSEKNQTLARQLTYRQIAYTLLRRQTFNEWVGQLSSIIDQNISIIPVQNEAQLPPASYPGSPAHIDLKGDEIDVSQLRAIELPDRIGTFQQAALAIQWESLPFYYEHRLLVIAQTATTVSEINQVEQRDFEYISPVAQAALDSVDDTTFTLSIRLQRFYDCLPDEAKLQWDSEEPQFMEDDVFTRTLSSLPDPEVVYQIIEIFNGNIEVQFEVFFDNDLEKYTIRPLGKRIAGDVTTLSISLDESDAAFFILTLTINADPAVQERAANLNTDKVRISTRRASAATTGLTILE